MFVICVRHYNEHTNDLIRYDITLVLVISCFDWLKDFASENMSVTAWLDTARAYMFRIDHPTYVGS